MCCCGKPIKNGEPGYRWQPNDQPFTHPVDPPPLREGELLLYDEPGRCGGLDAHSHHYRLLEESGRLILAVRNGAGDSRIWLRGTPRVALIHALAQLDSDARFWLLSTLWSTAHHDAVEAQTGERVRWQQAAYEKRLKVDRRGRTPKVWIEPETAETPEREG